MDKNILVSVIIPVYNTSSFVEECINSVLSQTYSNLDVIVINDGSKDNSAEICRRFQDVRLRFIDRENRGLSATRQEGIDLAKGDFFCTLDSDDTYDVTFVDKMLTAILESNSDICVCERYDFDDNSKARIPLSNNSREYKLIKERVEKEFEHLSSSLALSDSWNKLYRTSFVKHTNIRFTLNNKFNGTDLLFNHLLILNCPNYVVVNEPLMNHRIVLGSRVHRKNVPYQEGFNIITYQLIEHSISHRYPKSFDKVLGDLYYGFCNTSLRSIAKDSSSISVLLSNIKELHEKMDDLLNCTHIPFSYHKVSKVKILDLLVRKSLLNRSILAYFGLYAIFHIKK